jgi:hypothetical protein
METANIHIGLIESTIALIIFIGGLGIAWSSLKRDVHNIKEDLGEIKSDS